MVNVVKLIVLLNVFKVTKLTGLLIVVNVFKKPALVVLVNVMKMAGLVIVVSDKNDIVVHVVKMTNLFKCFQSDENDGFSDCGQCVQNNGFGGFS